MIFLKKLFGFLSPLKPLIYISLAVWVMHIILRVLLLFRNNPYGFPFVSKPDWYIFHAVCYDFIWICNTLLVFTIVAGLIQFIVSRKNSAKKSEPAKASKHPVFSVCIILYAIFHGILLPVTFLDHELLRFLGSHLSFGLANTYKDTSSIVMFWDYVANDLSVPYLQFVVLILMFPFTYGVYRLLKKANWSFKGTAIFLVIFYIASSLFVNVIWTGNARATKLRPVTTLVWNEIFSSGKAGGLSSEELAQHKATFEAIWNRIEGDSLWIFPKDEASSKSPLFRIPAAALTQDSALLAKRTKHPNFIVVFMESHRGLNTGFLNPGMKPSPTPYFDSLAASSRVWARMHTSGLPTTGGVLSSHVGIPHHSKLAQATDLAHVFIPSFASVLTDSGYTTHYFSAADPAWDNLGVWMSKWYTAQHYDRNREDDSTFFDHAITYVNDTLATQDKPFLVTLMTRSNHYPFNFAAGMTDEQKNLPLTERVKVTMNYADRQLARFMRSVENKEWFQNTYVIIMADHGFPLGENGVSTMNGGAFSNATWIPFLIHGEGIEAQLDTATAAQIDVAPTILELAGLAVPNMFMGHNLLRGHGEGLSLGAYNGYTAIGYEGLRLITRHPEEGGDIQGLFAEGDTHQNEDLQESRPQDGKRLKDLMDSLIRLADYSLERGF